jgi:hypothetical protein
LQDGISKFRADADARQPAEVEAWRQQEAGAAEARDRQDTEAKRQQESKAIEERAHHGAEAKREAEEVAPRKIEPTTEEPRVVAASLNAEERAELVKRVQEVLKGNHCYQGAVNGSPDDDVQAGLNRFVESAHKKGLEKPVRIELAKASASDFETWLRDAGETKGGLCVTAVRPRPAERPRRATNYPSFRGSGGQGGGMIQGVK